MIQGKLAVACAAILLAFGACGSTDSNAHNEGHEGNGKHATHEGHNTHGHGKHGDSNDFMHKSSFDTLVARFEDPAREEWQKRTAVIEALGPLEDMTVADLGAGTGYFSFPLAAEAKKVIALDIDDRFLDYIKENKPRRSKIVTRKTAESEINLKAGEADLVLTVNTWHHISDRVDYAGDLLDKLPEGGRFVIVDFFKEELPVGPPPFHKITHKRVRRELFQAGFASTSMDTTTLPYQYIITGFK